MMDLLVTSHLRWNFVFQRPQHLMSRFARDHRVFFWEEPVRTSGQAFLETSQPLPNLRVLVPHLPSILNEEECFQVQERLLAQLMEREQVTDYCAWYYSPMSVHFTRNLRPAVVVYDCMDELSAFRGAPPGLRAAEAELFRRADLVFTGGESLYKVKCLQHSSVHCFPSSIDQKFFQTARNITCDPKDQASIPHPRLGYAGVIDERMDMELLSSIAAARPDWHMVMIGPVVKIQDSDLARGPNIHYLGEKPYAELPSYLSGWDIGMLPFAINESTRFISPTKTPEYLAAGLQVISTPIADVVSPYGETKLVQIADSCEAFVAAAERAIQRLRSTARLSQVDEFLKHNSWDITWSRMAELVAAAVKLGREPICEVEKQPIGSYAS